MVRKMKKFIGVIAFLAFAASFAFAKDYVATPEDQKGRQAEIDYAGCTTGGTAGYSAEGLVITTSGTAASGVCYGVILGTGTSSSRVYLEDGKYAKTTKTLLAVLEFATTPQVITFPAPIKFSDGLTMTFEAAAGVVGAVFYRKNSDNQ